MKACLCLLFLTFASATANEVEVTPVQKVIELLGGMLEKGKAEKHEEAVQYAAYKQFCDDTSAEKERAISEANEQIEILKADIEKYAADAERLTKEITEHEADISSSNGDVKAATKVRLVEKADYEKTHADYSESISALERAIAVLKKQAYSRKQAESPEAFVQVSALKKLKLIPQWAKQAMDTLLIQDQGSEEQGFAESAPEANAYDFQSSGAIQMLEKLLDKFVGERTELEKEEMNSASAYKLLMMDLKAQIQQAEQDRTEKTEMKAKAQEAKAQAARDLEDTTSGRDADEAYLSELTATCQQKGSDFEARQQLRADELIAIEKAMDIIGGAAVKGAAEEHLPSLMQTGSALSQLRSKARSPTQTQAAEFLQRRAEELNSRILSAMAARASDDPFGKVKKMIKDLIVRLMEEANEEADHKGWCDTELSTNEQTRKEKTAAVETLHSEIDELEASISKLTEQIAELSKAIAEMDAAMAEATKLRQEEKAKNTETIEDAKAAQTAVAQAMVVLKEFYAGAAEATALVQQQPEAPEIFDKPYQGMQAENGGVLGMLEVIESDFARLQTDTEAAEVTAQKEYDTFMTDSEVDKSKKNTDMDHKTEKKQDEEQALTLKRADLEGTQKELDAALAYFDKLKPSCVDAGVSFEERGSRRKEEIQSLQEALKILNGEEIA